MDKDDDEGGMEFGQVQFSPGFKMNYETKKNTRPTETDLQTRACRVDSHLSSVRGPKEERRSLVTIVFVWLDYVWYQTRNERRLSLVCS